MKQFLDILFLLFLIPMVPGAQVWASPKATAVDRIALPLFEVSERAKVAGSAEAFSKKLQSDLAENLQKKTYLGVRTIDRVVPLSLRRSAVKKAAGRAGVDGVLVGQVRRGQVRMALLSGEGGPALVKWVIPTPKKMNKKGLRQLTQEIVNAVVDAVPYRGFVLDKRRDVVKLSIGKQESIVVGQKLQVFEFLGDSFSSDQELIGEVEVLKVKRETAYAREMRGDIPKYAKISFDSSLASHLSARNHVSSKSYARVGFEVLAFETEFPEDKELVSRDYTLNFTPMLGLGIGGQKWEVDLVYGKAESSFNNVTFTFVTGQYQLLSWGDATSGWILAAGVTGRQFKAELVGDEEEGENEEANDVALEDAVGVHPFADLRWSWIPRNRTKIYAGSRVLFGMSEKGGDSANAISSAGLGLYGGVRVDLTNDFGVEAGVRTQYAQIQLKNDFSFTESQLTIFWRSVILF